MMTRIAVAMIRVVAAALAVTKVGQTITISMMKKTYVRNKRERTTIAAKTSTKGEQSGLLVKVVPYKTIHGAIRFHMECYDAQNTITIDSKVSINEVMRALGFYHDPRLEPDGRQKNE